MPSAKKLVTGALTVALPFAVAACGYTEPKYETTIINVPAIDAGCKKITDLAYLVYTKPEKANIGLLTAKGTLDGGVVWQTKDSAGNVDFGKGTCSIDGETLYNFDTHVQTTKRYVYTME